MRLEKIKTVILDNDPARIVESFRDLSASERSRVAKPIREFVRDLVEYPNYYGRRSKNDFKNEIHELGHDMDKLECRFQYDSHPSLTTALYATQPQCH